MNQLTRNLVISGVVLLGIVVLFFQVGGAVKTWWEHKRNAEVIKEDTGAKQEIQEALDAAHKAQAAADAAKQKSAELSRQVSQALALASRREAEARQLSNRVAELEAQRKAEPIPKTRAEIQAAWKALGYAP